MIQHFIGFPAMTPARRRTVRDSPGRRMGGPLASDHTMCLESCVPFGHGQGHGHGHDRRVQLGWVGRIKNSELHRSVATHRTDGQAGALSCPVGVFAGVETRRREVLRTVQGELAIPPQLP